MEFEVLGWPPDGPKLRLDHERFAYAGKFVMTATGKAVCRASDGEGDADDVVAAVAFNEDRTDPDRLWLRYVTVRDDHRGDGVGPRLADATARRAAERDYERVAIAANNPYAYEAMYRAGFEFTGETTGIAELVLERPSEHGGNSDRPGEGGGSRKRPAPERYHEGLAEFADRDDLGGDERAFVDEKRASGPPETLATAERL